MELFTNLNKLRLSYHNELKRSDGVRGQFDNIDACYVY